MIRKGRLRIELTEQPERVSPSLYNLVARPSAAIIRVFCPRWPGSEPRLVERATRGFEDALARPAMCWIGLKTLVPT
jgi:hypothetical protein